MAVYHCGYLYARIKVLPKGTLFNISCRFYGKPANASDCKTCKHKIKVLE